MIAPMVFLGSPRWHMYDLYQRAGLAVHRRFEF